MTSIITLFNLIILIIYLVWMKFQLSQSRKILSGYLKHLKLVQMAFALKVKAHMNLIIMGIPCSD